MAFHIDTETDHRSGEEAGFIELQVPDERQTYTAHVEFPREWRVRSVFNRCWSAIWCQTQDVGNGNVKDQLLWSLARYRSCDSATLSCLWLQLIRKLMHQNS